MSVRCKLIRDYIYKKHFHLIVNCSQEELVKWLKRHEDHEEVEKRFSDGSECDVQGKCMFFPTSHAYLWVRSFDWSIEDQAILVHEIIHMVDHALEVSGITLEPGPEASEVRAYYTEYIFTKVWDALKPKEK